MACLTSAASKDSQRVGRGTRPARHIERGKHEHKLKPAFCAARLSGQGGRVYGTLPAGVDAKAIIDRTYLV